MSKTVAVIGGGYGGIAVATTLDDIADVVVIEPRDAFVHNVAALRGLVDPAWAERLFFPYDDLLTRGRVVHDRATQVDTHGVTVSSGERIGADYIVLATGSGYPFPAKYDIQDAAGAKSQIRATHVQLKEAPRVLLLGAGPVGLELAGEIKAAWPDKSVTIVDPATDILSGNFPTAFRDEVRGQLETMDIRLVLGATLTGDPATSPGQAATFITSTTSGTELEADIWFRCFGVTRTSDYLAEDLATARRTDGSVDVTAGLTLPGHDHVFAIGDITSIPEAKMAKAAGEHAEVVAANIRTMITGSGDLRSYTAAPPAIALPLGPLGGATYAEGVGILDAATTSEIKGAHLRIDNYEELFGTREIAAA